VSTLVGGAILLSAMRKPSPSKAALVVGAGALLHRGVTGHCYVYKAIGVSSNGTGLAHFTQQERPAKSITIEKPAEELYQAWRDPKHVSELMRGFAEIEGIGNDRWRWHAKLPMGKTIEWTTTTVENKPNELIAWKTGADAPFTHEGSVRFRRAPGDRGTEVTLTMGFGTPGGVLSALADHLFKRIPKTLEEGILRRCKAMMVAGEAPTLDKNPSARRSVMRTAAPRALPRH
jgi:uncharacterized membrane protein